MFRDRLIANIALYEGGRGWWSENGSCAAVPERGRRRGYVMNDATSGYQFRDFVTCIRLGARLTP